MKVRILWLLCLSLTLTTFACTDDDADKSNTDEETNENQNNNTEENQNGDSTVTKICEPKTFRCAEDNASYFICSDDGTAETETKCESNNVCDTDEKKCVQTITQPTCNTGDARCTDDPSKIEKCIDGDWQTQNCDPDQICNDNACIYTDCTPNVDICAGSGKAIGMYKCTEKGQIGDLIDYCPLGCNNDNSACLDNNCDTEGEYSCSPDLIESRVCKNGTWTTNEVCPDVALCDDGKCKKTVCQPNVDVCAGNGKAIGMYKCTPSGQIGELIDYCPLGCNNDNSACAECTTKSVNCTKDGIFQYCDNGSWTDLVDCGHAESCSSDPKSLGCTCTAGGGALTVQPELRCSNNNSILEECIVKKNDAFSYTAWSPKQDCGAEEMCVAGSKTPYCQCTDKYVCDSLSNTLMACKDGRLVVYQACAKSQTCNAETGTCDSVY